MEEDQLGNVLDDLLGIAKFLETSSGHSGPDDLVMVKRHPIRAELTGVRLSNVVEKRGQSQDQVGRRLVDNREGVRQHVLVTVLGVLLHRQREKLGEKVSCKPRSHQPMEDDTGRFGGQQLRKLVADPLCRHDLEAIAHRCDCVERLRVRIESQ